MNETQRSAAERLAFEQWYDAQPDGRIDPWDVWQAAALLRELAAEPDLAVENKRLRAAIEAAEKKLSAIARIAAIMSEPDTHYIKPDMSVRLTNAALEKP